MVSVEEIEQFMAGKWKFEDDYNEVLIKQELDSYKRHQERKKNQIPEIVYLYPSSLWMCYLVQFLQRKLPKTKSLESLKILDFGNMFHDHLIARVMNKKYGTLLTEEAKIKEFIEDEKIMLSGRIDDLLLFKDPATQMTIAIPIEGKTTGTIKYMKAPKLSHIQQLMIYLKNKEVPGGYLVYIARSGYSEDDVNGEPIGISKTFYVPMDWEVWEQLKHRAINMANYIRKDQVPYPEAKMNKNTKKQCGYCAYKPECNELMRNYKEFQESDKSWDKFCELVIIDG